MAIPLQTSDNEQAKFVESSNALGKPAIRVANPDGTLVGGGNGHIITDTGSVTNATLSAETTKVIGVTRSADGTGNLLTSTSQALDVNLKTSAATVAANATLSAETTKVIGVTRSADGSGNLLTSTSQALDVNLKTSAATVTVTGTITTTPPSNASTNVAQFGGTAVVNGGVAGVQSVGGNVANAVTATTNPVPVGGIFSTTPATLTNGQTATLQFTPAQNTKNDITTIAGTAPTTVGKIDIKGTDGDVFVRQATAANLNATVVPGNATGSAVPANAFYNGMIAKTALPTAATDGNLTGSMSDKFGRSVVLPIGMRDLILPMTQLTLTSTTTETTLITAVASTFLDIISLVVVNTSATATQVNFKDSTAGTTRLSLYIPAGDMRGIALPTPLPQNAVNNNWTATCGTSVASVIITGTYVTNK